MYIIFKCGTILMENNVGASYLEGTIKTIRIGPMGYDPIWGY